MLSFQRGGVDYVVAGSIPPDRRRDRRAPARMSDRHPIEARGLVKRYGHVTAVDRVDLTVEAGCVYGYLGPNGAGKTTSLRMLLGLIRPTRASPGCSAAIRCGRARRRSTASRASSRRRASTRT